MNNDLSLVWDSVSVWSATFSVVFNVFNVFNRSNDAV